MEQIDRFATFLTSWRAPWWLWPAVLLAMAVLADGAAMALRPLDANWVGWPGGARFGETCLMIVESGYPCPQCGMTRSWVHGVRGDLVTAWLNNPAGLALFLWINAGGLVGAVRLATRSPRRLTPPVWLLFGWTVTWLLGLYTVGYALRLGGLNPLPDTRVVGQDWPVTAPLADERPATPP